MARPLQPSEAKPEASGFVQRGKVLIVRRQFQDAVKVCRIGLLAAPTNVEGRLILGLALGALGRHDEVLAEMRVALELKPDNAMAHLLKGEALCHLKRYDLAREVLTEALRLDPNNEKVHTLLAEVEQGILDLSGDLLPGVPTITKVYPAKGAQDVEQPGQLDSLVDAESGAIAVVPSYDPSLDGDTDAEESVDVPIDLSQAVADPPLASKTSDPVDDAEFSTALWLPPTKRPPMPEATGWEKSLTEEVMDDDTDADASQYGRALEDESEPTELDPLDGVLRKNAARSPLKERDTEAPRIRPSESLSTDASFDHHLPSFGTDSRDEEAFETESGGNVAVIDEDADDGYRTVINVDAPPPEALFGDDEEQFASPKPHDLSFDAGQALDEKRSFEDPAETSAAGAGWGRRLAGEATAAVPIDDLGELVSDPVVNRRPSLDQVVLGRRTDVADAVPSLTDDSPFRSHGTDTADEADWDDPASGPLSLDEINSRLSDDITPPPIASLPSLTGSAPRVEIDRSEQLTVDAPQVSIESPEDEPSVPDELLSTPVPGPSLAPKPSFGLPPRRLEPTAPIEAASEASASDAELSEISQLSVLADIPEGPPPAGPILPERSVRVLPAAMPPVPVDDADDGELEGKAGEFEGAFEADAESQDISTRIRFAGDGPNWDASAPRAQDVEASAGYQEKTGDNDFDDQLAERPLGDWPLDSLAGDPAPIGVPEQPGGGNDHELGVEPAEGDRGGGYFAEEGFSDERYPDDYPPRDDFQQPYDGYPNDQRSDEHYPGEHRPADPFSDEHYPPDDPYSDDYPDQYGAAHEARQSPYPHEPEYDQDYEQEADHGYPEDDDYGYHDYEKPFESFDSNSSHARRPTNAPPGAELAARFGRTSGDDGAARFEDISRGDGLLEQMTGAEPSRYDPAPHRAAPALIDRRRSVRRPASRSTTFLTILLGEPGSRRWVVLLAGSVGVLVLAVGVGLLVRHLRVSDEIESQHQEALARLERGNYQDFDHAHQIFDNILRRRSDQHQVRAALLYVNAALHFEFGTPIPAEQRAVPVDGSIGEEDRAVVEIYNALIGGDLEKAIQLSLESRTSVKNSARLLYLEGRIQLLRGKPLAAIQSLEQAWKLKPSNVMFLRWLAEAHATNGEHDKALSLFEKALELNKDHLGTVLGRSRLLINQRRDLQNVKRSLRELLQPNRLASRGQRGWANLLLARLTQLQAGKEQEAKKYIRETNNSSPVADPVFLDELAAVRLPFNAGDAERTANASEKLMPGRPQPSYRLAQIYNEQGRPHEALKALERAKGLQKSSLLKARIHLQLNQVEQARKEVEEALRRAPHHFEAKILKAEVLAAAGQASQAEAILAPLHGREPKKNAMITTALGKILLMKGEPDKAREKFQLAISQDRHAVEASLLLADALLAEGKYDKAHESLSATTRQFAWNFTALRKLAELDYGRWDLGQAKSDLRLMLQKASGDRVSRLLLVRVLTDRREYSAAQRELSRVDGSDPQLELVRGQLALGRGKASKAARHLSTATRDNPSHAGGWLLYVQALDYNGTAYPSSIIRTMEAKCSGAPETFVVKGKAAFNAGNFRGARKHFSDAINALKRHPRSPRVAADIYVALGMAYRDDSQIDRALAEFEKARKVCKLCPLPMQRMGMGLDEKGRHEEAAQLLEQARKTDPNNPEIYLDLGKVYENLGRTREAKKMYKKYLGFPKKAFADEASDRLRNLR